jgi:uncharacterized membrane protein YtjA (UPF0391 family)
MVQPLSQQEKGPVMLGWIVGFLAIALIAALLGFVGIAGAAAGVAQILFYIFMALFLIGIVVSLVRGRAA